MGYIHNFGPVDLFVDLISLNNLAAISLSSTAKFPSNNQFSSSNPTTSCLMRLKISGQIDLDLMNMFTPCQI